MSNKGNKPILIIDRPSCCADLLYASGFDSEDCVVLLKNGSKINLVVSDMEKDRAARRSDIEVNTPRTLRIPVKARRKLSNWALYLMRSLRIRSVFVPSQFPVGVADTLRRKGINIKVSKNPVFPERAIKSAKEISFIKQAQQAGVFAIRAATEVIRKARINKDGWLESDSEKLTAEYIRSIILQVLTKHNCSAHNTIVAPGVQAADPHEAGHGPVRSGSGIVMDVFPRHNEHGYWGDITRTICAGRPSDEYRRMYAAVKASQQAALDKIKPGVKCSTVHNAAVLELQRHGFKTFFENGRPHGFIHSTGHGVGLDIHEAPAISDNDTRFRKGHVITVEPGLYYPDIGGVRIEDTVVVTGKGWQYLVPCEKKLEIS